jgi:small subunit ribosomal protein S9
MAEEHKKTVKKEKAAPKAKAPVHKKPKEEPKAEELKTHEHKEHHEHKAAEHKAVEHKHHEHKAAEHKPVVAHKPKKKSLPKGEKYYGTGRRKEATAKVWLTPGSGKMTLNGKSLKEYFCGRRLLEFIATRPFVATKTEGKFDVHAELLGGGVPSQADAIRMGIARALVVLNPALKTILKHEGLMTRDPRMKERKKYGLKRARRAFQYTKR